MKILQLGIIVLAVLLFWLPASVAGIIATSQNSPIAVITSPAYNPGEISRNTLRAIFVMRYPKWSDGTPVKVYVFADSAPEHELFTKEILKFFPSQLRQAWDRQVFSGLGQYPEQVSSAKEMLAKVKATPGSIGYILTQEVNKDVRILQIYP